MATFGENLRRARRRAGLTQFQLSARLQSSVSGISAWEQAARWAPLPTPRTIRRIAEALGCTPASLLRDVVTPYDRLRGEVLSDDDRLWLDVGRTLSLQVRQEYMRAITKRRFTNGGD